MRTTASTVEEYLAGLPEDRRVAVSAVRDVVNEHLPEGYVEQLDVGKSCLRFKKLEDLPLDVIGETVAAIPVDEYVARYEATRGAR